MLKAIPQPREDVSDWAPKMTTMHINPDKIREVIGKGGSVIQNIVAESGAKVDIEDDGTVTIAAVKATDADKAKKMIEAIVKEPEPGEIYYGKVVRLMNFGAFVNLLPGKDGMVHISKMADHRIEKVEDAVKEGDMVWVKVMEIDDKGRVNLSMKDVKPEEKILKLNLGEKRKKGSSFARKPFYSSGIYSIMSETLQFRIKHSVSSVFSVIVLPCFMRCRILAEKPCL